MDRHPLTRWQQFYVQDPSLSSIAPSQCATRAARAFASDGSRLVLDLGCGTGRDSLYLASQGIAVIGLDAARAGLALAQSRSAAAHVAPLWLESDARLLPFADACFDGVYCFGLLHEFVGEPAAADVQQTTTEIDRVLKSSGMAILAVASGDPEKGLPAVQNFSEAMFDEIISNFNCIEKEEFYDLGCTGRTDYKVWYAHLQKQ